MDRHLWGFRGLHGGLAAALLAAAAQQHAPPAARLRSASASFLRPIVGPFDIHIAVLRTGRTTALAAHAVTTDRTSPTVDAVINFDDHTVRASPGPLVSPSAPAAPSPTDCERLLVPVNFAPISAYIDVRPVGTNRPFAGCAEPELAAWVRLTDTEDAPDDFRLLLLMDALAPAYAALLHELQPIPTVHLAAQFTRSSRLALSPWTLLQSRTIWADQGGWIEEHTTAWDASGNLLGTAQQLRLLIHEPRAHQ